MAITWNPDDKGVGIALSNNDLTATQDGTDWKAVRNTKSKSSGKWYWEIKIDISTSNDQILVGIGTSLETLTYPGDSLEGYGYYAVSGGTYHSASTAYGSAYTADDTIGVALDLDNGKIWWAKNGTWQASGVPASGTNPAYTGVSGVFFAMVGLNTPGDKVTANFGATTLTYSAPIGFSTLDVLDYTGYFSGYVYEQSSPIARTLYLHYRGDGSLVDTTTSSGNGYYYLETTYSGSHYIVCLDDPAGASYNDLIIGNVIPTTVSG